MNKEFKDIENKWQQYWQEKQTFFTDLTDKSKPKKYVLAMHPYPSGSGLHIGHVRTYTIADAMARFYRMKGYNVLFPIGWDAFGLPAEQYSIQTNNHPAKFTADNIQVFKKQLQKTGFSFDWSKEINSSEPDYYHWTQWIFKQIYLEKLAEYKKIPVYWCEKLGTVLSNEEIKTIDGQKVSERGSYPVIQKSIPQWILKITNYAEKLLADLQQINWPNSIKSLQTNWIGLASGTLIDFSLAGNSEKITVFTMSPQTLYGVIAIALSTSHPLIAKIAKSEHQEKTAKFCAYWNLKEKEEKKEIFGEFTGGYCVNPINNKLIPIWVANFVIADYGTGAVMINPFQEEIFDFSKIGDLLTKKEIKQNQKADFAFAQKYNLPVNKIIEIDDNGGSFVNSPLINGLKTKKEAIKIINNHLEKIGKGKKHNTYHLRDWIFSRQRYWGEPIPIIHWENGEQEILKDEKLPLKLPSLADFTPSPLYYSPLQKVKDWVIVERKDGLIGKRDVNVMPQWAGSCWYYLAYLLKQKDNYLPLNGELAKEIINFWLPVDLYIGGQEHANLHLLYARFWHKILNKIGLVRSFEPFQKLLCQGMILGTDGEKMSKSKGNIINPDQLIEECGADALRLAITFLAPPEQTTAFKLEGTRAMRKWLDRVYHLFIFQTSKFAQNIDIIDAELIKAYQEMISKSAWYYEKIKLNLIPPLLMIFVNKCYQAKKIPFSYGKHFLQILNPLAPHLAEEIWSKFDLSCAVSLAHLNWPKIEIDQYNESKVNVIVLINGKKKEVVSLIFKKKDKDVLISEVKNNPIVNRHLQEKKIKKIIYLEREPLIVNFVLA